MHDYEIRDIMRRSTTPDLFLDLKLPRGDYGAFDYAPHQEMSKPVPLRLVIGNRSSQPAHFTVIHIGISDSIKVLHPGDFDVTGVNGEGANKQVWLIRRMSTPPHLPIFQEADVELGGIDLGFHSRLLPGVHRFVISTLIQSPGCTANAIWHIQQEGTSLRLLEPSHPLTR
jgi:hypothetical protein